MNASYDKNWKQHMPKTEQLPKYHKYTEVRIGKNKITSQDPVFIYATLRTHQN